VRALGSAFVVVLCTLVTMGCGGNSGEPTATPEPPQAETTPTASRSRVTAPVVAGTSVDGKPISLTDYRGQAVLINVWSSW